MFPGEQQLGRYRLLKLIATGGMGEIHLAEDASINRQVAIKVIRSESALYAGESSSSDAARLFEREAKAIAMLDHPHILPLYDYGEEKRDGTVLTYLVMPYRPEGSLATWLEQRGPANPLSLADVESIITQTASALQYTHDHQLIHQDVKPSNFLIRSNRENPNRPDILISDFGIARISNMTSSSSQSIRGTPGYMSPEQWEGNALPASDQYALAVMAYELVTGRPPFKGNPMQMMYAHVHTSPQPPSSLTPGLPSALDAVILRGLAKKPADRFPTVSAFAQAFQQAVHGTLSSPLQLTNPYTSTQAAAVAGSYSRNTPGASDLYATLAISEAEASNGSDRLLTLPDGSQIPVTIPPGARNGQVLELSNTNNSTVGTPPNLVRLKLSVRSVPQGGNGVASLTSQRALPTNDALTYASGSASPSRTFTREPDTGTTSPSRVDANNPTVATRWQGGSTPPAPAPGALGSAIFGQTISPHSASGTSQFSGATPQQPASFANAPAAPFYAGAPPGGPNSPLSPGLPPRRSRRNSKGVLITLIIVALLLVLGGSVLAYAAHGGGGTGGGGGGGTPGVTATNSSDTYATQTALANAGQSAQSTATAQASATVSAQGTAGAQGTASAQASATAQANANATGTASATNPYGGILVFNDPMIDNSQGHNWDVISSASAGTSCQFTDNAYHMIMPGNYSGACFGQTTSFNDFAFQVQMKFLKYGQHFSGGGLIFRSTNNSDYYVLEIFESGQYTFFSCKSGGDCSHGIAGYPQSSQIPSFHTGLNQVNTIAVVAQGNTFTFYANGQTFAGPITDDTNTNGALGFYAEGGSEGGAGATTDVAYSNVTVWRFS